MLKKLLVGFLALTASLCCAFGVAACKGDKESGDEWGNVYTVQAAYAKAAELGYTGTLEEFIAAISGSDGTDGEDGLGISSVSINDDGQLVIVLSDKTKLNLGKIVGVDGEDGKDGLGIAKVEINDKGEIVITFTDESTENLGKIPDCDHSYSKWATGLEPTCTSIGYSTRTCSKCGYTDYKFAEKAGHTWNGGIVVKESNTTVKGLKIYSCTVCGTAKAEELELSKKLNETEWRAAIQATLNSDNLTIEANSDIPESSEPEIYEKIKINLDKGLSHFYARTTQADEAVIEEEIYTKLDKINQVGFERQKYVDANNAENSYTSDWTGYATESEYLHYKPWRVKFNVGADNSMLESLRYILTDNMWTEDSLALEDCFEYFVYNEETDTYDYSETDWHATNDFSLKFENGRIVSFINHSLEDGEDCYLSYTFSDYGATSVTIPEEVTEKVTESGLIYENTTTFSEERQYEIKTEYFGIPVTSIKDGSFSHCGLASVKIPASVTEIGDYAFYSCNNLKDVYFGGTKVQWEDVKKGAAWDEGAGKYTVHCSDGNISASRKLTEQEWREAVQRTIMSDNFSYEMTMKDSTGSNQTERVIINLDENKSWFYQEDNSNGEQSFVERYYIIDDVDKVYFGREEDSNGWYAKAEESDYADEYYKDTPEMVKYELNDVGYSFLESLKNIYTYEGMWGCDKPLAEVYSLFTYDGENNAYCFTEVDGNSTGVYSFKFDGGYITEIGYSFQSGDDWGEQVAKFSYGNAKVEIPQEVIGSASQEVQSVIEKILGNK